MPARRDEQFENNVFINCPFDSDYQHLLRPLLFIVISLGFHPKIALERSDSGELRITKICGLIKQSRYSIHDLSRLQSREANELYRMNMPFELGIEYGCRQFAAGPLKKKQCLILEKEKFEAMKALSDLSGVDVKSHGNDPAGLVREVRNWFVETVGLRGIDSPQTLWYRFNRFITDFYIKRRGEGFSEDDLSTMPVSEFIDFVRAWTGDQQ